MSFPLNIEEFGLVKLIVVTLGEAWPLVDCITTTLAESNSVELQTVPRTPK